MRPRHPPREQRVFEQLEWADELVWQAAPGGVRNPAGLYVSFLQDNVSPPPTFESSAKRKARDDARAAQEREVQKIQLTARYYKKTSTSTTKTLNHNSRDYPDDHRTTANASHKCDIFCRRNRN